jgi:hypothetical protein
VTGRGLTVMANAPNPAGFAILKGSSPTVQSIRSASPRPPPLPTLVAAAAFQFLP